MCSFVLSRLHTWRVASIDFILFFMVPRVPIAMLSEQMMLMSVLLPVLTHADHELFHYKTYTKIQMGKFLEKGQRKI